jgi:hypothetical protein
MGHEKNYTFKGSDCELLMETYLKPDSEENYKVESPRYEIDGTGSLIIRNTGGSSASEGGMGTEAEKKKDPEYQLKR